MSNNRSAKSLARQLVYKQASIVRKDISDWQMALRSATSASNPRQARLQELYTNIMRDAHLSSQILLRKSKVLSADWVLTDAKGNTDEQHTAALRANPLTRQLMEQIVDALFYGFSLVELSQKDGDIVATPIDRRHIEPRTGTCFIEQYDATGIAYRQLPEYGKTLLEFRQDDSLGLLNQACPHVLYRRFAQACWSELCEIYGMPPRYIKTDEQDPDLRSRYLQELAQAGSIPTFLLNSSDEIGFIPTNSGNGEVYQNLIQLCTNELSLLINGAVLGQDTVNGSNAKEQTSSELSQNLTFNDEILIEQTFASTVMPAMVRLGIIPEGLRLTFTAYEDTNALFQQTMQAANYFDIDPEWVKKKFGIEVTGIKSFGALKAPSQQHATVQELDRFFV